MSVNGKDSGEPVKPHGTGQTKLLDGVDQTRLPSPQEATGLILQYLPLLADALVAQAQAIDRLAASNEALVETLMADVQNDSGEPFVGLYMDGSKVS